MTFCRHLFSEITGHNENNLKWVIIYLTQTQQFSAISWREHVNFQLDDDEVRFILDQHAELNLYSARRVLAMI
jgi:hypothetical protein